MTKFLDAKIEFATLDEGQVRIATSDVYTKNLSAFDLSAKTRKAGELTEQDYLENAPEYVRSWTDDEIEYLRAMLDRLHAAACNLDLTVELPETIVFIKTTGYEEGGAAGYTRDNSVFLNRNSLSTGLVTHELFHIVSRYNPELTTAVYETLGFKACNDVSFPSELRITNPDAPFLRHYLQVSARGEQHDVVMVMISDHPYEGGSFFGYIRKRLLVVEGDDDRKVVKIVGGREVLIGFEEAIDLYDNIGRNTTYNIHQEEVSAVHFEMLMLGHGPIADPSLVRRMHTVLRAE